MSEPHTIGILPELVEHIILHLPLRDILLAQRVSKTWKDVITTSPTIQGALFRQPFSSPSKEQLQRIRAHKFWRIPLPFPHPGYFECTPFGVPEAAPLNPLLVPFLRFTVATGNDHEGTRMTFYHRQCIALLPVKAHILSDAPASASWRNMLLVQPLAAPLYELVHLSDSRQNRALRIEREGLSVEDLRRKTETHACRRRELEGGLGTCELSGEYAVGLRGGMHWVLGTRRVDEMAREEVVEFARGITGWDVVAAAAVVRAGQEGQYEGEGDGDADGDGDQDRDAAFVAAPSFDADGVLVPIFKSRDMDRKPSLEGMWRCVR